MEAGQIPKRTLFDDDDASSDLEVGGAPILKVNEEFAERFEHNKKREERHRLEEKYKREQTDGSGPESSESSDETEDEDGFLATEELDARISETLSAIRNKDPRIYDKEYKWFPEDGAVQPRAKKEKPMRLKDYHRERFLAGGVGASDSEGDDDAEKPKTFVEEQAELKKDILAAINDAADKDSDGDDGDEGFLKPKAPKKSQALDENGMHPSRAAPGPVLTEEDVAKADENPELYLSRFMAARAWVPSGGDDYKAFESDDGDSELERADEFESAFNMRFEDPEKSNEVLKTYARDIVASRSVRKENSTGRKRKRELEKEQKDQERLERAQEKARLKKLRLEETTERLEKVRKLAGTAGKRLTDDEMIKFLQEDWQDDHWEAQMKKRFGDDYYEEEDADMMSHDEGEDSDRPKKKKPKKPTWDDDIDIGDIANDESSTRHFTIADLEDDEQEGQDADMDDDERTTKKHKSSRDVKKERLQAERASKQSRTKLKALVDTMVELENPEALSRGRKSDPEVKGFRWRGTSPTGFGMTARDILLAPSDKALNRFAGIKKFVPYKDREAKEQERKRLSKKGRLRKWRREVFGKEFEKSGPMFGFEAVEQGEDEEVAKIVDIQEGEKRKRKRKRGHKKAVA
jgi:protein KRI1